MSWAHEIGLAYIYFRPGAGQIKIILGILMWLHKLIRQQEEEEGNEKAPGTGHWLKAVTPNTHCTSDASAHISIGRKNYWHHGLDKGGDSLPLNAIRWELRTYCVKLCRNKRQNPWRRWFGDREDFVEESQWKSPHGDNKTNQWLIWEEGHRTNVPEAKTKIAIRVIYYTSKSFQNLWAYTSTQKSKNKHASKMSTRYIVSQMKKEISCEWIEDDW